MSNPTSLKFKIGIAIISFIIGAAGTALFQGYRSLSNNDVSEDKELIKIRESVNEVYDLHSDKQLSEESRIKTDKIRQFIKENPHLKSVAESRIKLGSVFVDMKIPVNEHDAAWDYYNREIDKLKVIKDKTELE